MKITRAQFPEERVNFRKANGETKTLSVVIRKQYEGETDYLPEKWHERLKIALAHDSIRIEGEKYLGDIAQDGEYQIEWPDFLDYPTGKANFKVQVTPFAETNSNCMSCQEATQLSLVDHTVTALYGEPLQEGESYTADLASNDNICCYPAIFSAVWYNTDYLDSFSINAETGVINITLNEDLISANGLKIATYRVTCPNGSYDEADVYADIEGSTEGCLAPTHLVVFSNNPNDITFNWTEPFPDASYYYELYEGSLPVGSPVQSGLIDITTSVTLSGLDPETDYYFRVRTVCYGSNSNYATVTATTPVQGANCGSYTVAVDDGSGDPSILYFLDYQGCDGQPTQTNVYNLQSVVICSLQTAPGSPVFIFTPYGNITYNGEC